MRSRAAGFVFALLLVPTVVALVPLVLARAAMAQPRVPVTNPLALLAVQQAQLTASGGAAGDEFGYAVALAGDTALVGARGGDVGGNVDQGSAYVFVRSDTGWSQQAQLTASGGAAGDEFGYAVALAGDTALVGAPLDDAGPIVDQGSAYVFVRSDTGWSQQAQLAGSVDATGDKFGYAVALAGDTALVGAPLDDAGAASQGSASVFTRSGAAWSQQAQVTARGGTTGDAFGYAVALDRDTALVGAPGDNVDGKAERGSVSVFARSRSIWSQQAQLTASGGAADDWFGWSVALAGGTALVGAPYCGGGPFVGQGSASVFLRSGSIWSQQAQLTASGATARAEFGYRVALAGDTALAGAPGVDIGAKARQGAAYVLTLPTMLGTPTCPRSIRPGKPFSVHGALKPHFTAGARTVRVKAYRCVSRKWRLYRSYAAVNADSGSASKYTAKIKLARKGKYRFKACVAATAQRTAAASGFSRTLKVK